MQAPGHDEHPDGKNTWALQYSGEDQERFKVDEVYEAGALLLGRVTYEIWAAFWPTAPKDEGFADKINAMPKYVVSTRMREATWGPAEIISTNVAERIRELKQEDGDDILLVGSADLLNSLVPHDVIDEFRLMLFPVLLGSGKRLFAETTDVSHLELVETRRFESGVVLLTYLSRDRGPTSKYVDSFAWSREQQRSWEAVRDVDRVLATVLFTDIVGSTQKAAEIGDQAWRGLIDRHDKASRAEVERYKGRYVKSTGDGMLATFDAPTRALRCALGLNEALRGSGLEIRSAIHTGEIEELEEDVGGIAVHIAARALGEAGGGEIVVTRTVRELCAGTDLSFTPLGSVGLRGVPGEWELFSVT